MRVIYKDSNNPKSDKMLRLKTFSSQFVDGTAEGYKILYKVYPDHIYDSLRRKIAVELSGKEIAKILDADDDQLINLHYTADSLYDGRQGVYAPVHDFWSFVEMILHVKKKELPELITAANVDWTVEEMSIDHLHITWMPFIEQHFDIFGPKPWRITDIKNIFKEKPEVLEMAVIEQRKTVGSRQHNFDQTGEPIVVVHRNDNLELIDGNGRLFKTLLDGEDKISCYIGRLSGPMPIDYWVSAGALKQFCLEIRSYAEVGLSGFDDGLSYLRTKLRNNVTALINYELFLRRDFPEFEDGLSEVLP